MHNIDNAASMVQHIYKLTGGHRPKGDDESDDEGDDAALEGSKSNAKQELEEDEGSDADTSHTETDTDATESVGTGMEDEDEEDDDDDEFADLDAAVETPAMLAKKVATAASMAANSDAKKKATIASKRALASSKPPKGKATLHDITTLQNSYDDLEHTEGGGDSDDSYEDDDDIDDGNNYLRKFETDMHENYIASHHHEMLHLNNAEVNALARVVRNTDGVIIDVMHKTMPFLTKYEKTRILGQRAKQLNQGAQPMIPVDKKIIDGYLIAQLELQQKALPFIIRRPLPGGKSEYWRVADLELI